MSSTLLKIIKQRDKINTRTVSQYLINFTLNFDVTDE